jgi:hypothetical protein
MGKAAEPKIKTGRLYLIFRNRRHIRGARRDLHALDHFAQFLRRENTLVAQLDYVFRRLIIVVVHGEQSRQAVISPNIPDHPLRPIYSSLSLHSHWLGLVTQAQPPVDIVDTHTISDSASISMLALFGVLSAFSAWARVTPAEPHAQPPRAGCVRVR